MSKAELAEYFDKDNTSAGIIATKILPTGNLKLFFSNLRAKEAFSAKALWTTLAGETATIAEPTFDVLVHNMCIASTNTQDPNLTNNITAQNNQGRPALKVTRAKWLHQNHPENKTHAALVLTFISPEDADYAIERGIILNHTMHVAVLHNHQYMITQCFKCQKYGHISTNCRRETKCGRCAGDHSTQACDRETNTPKCANCARRHFSWSGECPHRQQHRNLVDLKRTNSPTYYKKTTPQNHSQVSVTPAKRAIGGAGPEWQLAPQRRGPGRPTKMSYFEANQARLFPSSSQPPASSPSSSQEPNLGTQMDTSTC